MPESPRSLAGRIGAHARWAKEDPVQGTAAARQGLQGKFLNEVDPDRVLPEAERNRRAEHAKKAHYLRMAAKSAEARRKRKK